MAFVAIVSIGTVGLYVAYVIPVFLRLRAGSRFRVGPWNLGRWSPLIGWAVEVWVAVITILFFAPAFWPWNTAADLNWAGPLLVAVMALVTLWWFVSARTWFTGPRVQGTPEELAEIERDPSLGQIDDRFR